MVFDHGQTHSFPLSTRERPNKTSWVFPNLILTKYVLPKPAVGQKSTQPQTSQVQKSTQAAAANQKLDYNWSR